MAIQRPAGEFDFSYAYDMATVRRRWQWLALLIFLALLYTLPLYASQSIVSLVNRIGIAIIAVQGLNLLTGYTGQISIGQAAFMTVGGYISALLVNNLGWHFLAALPAAALGAVEIQLVESCCKDCNLHTNQNVIKNILESTNNLLRFIRKELLVSFISPQNKHDKTENINTLEADVSRRDLLGSFLKQVGRTSASLALNLIEQETNSKTTNFKPGKELHTRLPYKRNLLLISLRKIYDSKGYSGIAMKSRLFTDLIISAQCTGCHMCAFFCPTGALYASRNNNTSVLKFRQADCVNCSLCEDICYQNAIKLQSETDLKKILGNRTETFASFWTRKEGNWQKQLLG